MRDGWVEEFSLEFSLEKGNNSYCNKQYTKVNLKWILSITDQSVIL